MKAAFTQAHDAHQAGDHAGAHKGSQLGKLHKTLMEAANARAAATIIDAQSWKEGRKLDLHGLFVAEAEKAATEFVNHHLQHKKHATLDIVTGAGHHSRDHKCHISPVVVKMLNQKGLQFSHPHGNQGDLLVHLLN